MPRSRTAVLRPRCWSGRKSTFSPLLEGPLQRPLGVGGGADRAAVLAGERLDVGGGVHVRDGHDLLGDAGLGQHVPALGDLLGGGHVGHRAAGGQVGQDDLLVVGGEDVRGLGHEVHAAEDDVLGLRPGRRVPGELEGVAGHVGELDDLVALVVVAEDEDLVPELLLGRAGALHEVRVGRRRAGRRGSPRRARSSGRPRGRAGAGRAGVGWTSRGWAVVTTRTLSSSAEEPFRLFDAIYHNRFTSV